MNFQRLITPLILLIASVGLFFAFINKEFKKTQELRKDVLVYEDALDKARELKERRDALQKKLITIGEANLTDIEKILPDSVDTVRMIMDLNGIASRYGIVIKMIRIDDPKGSQKTSPAPQNAEVGKTPVSEEAYGAIGITFTVTTTYEKFVEFLKDLEGSLRIIDVTSISLKPDKENSTYEFGVSARTYWLK